MELTLYYRGPLPRNAAPPFFCLLEDDGLITSVAVRTDRLLDVDPVEKPRDVVALVRARAIYPAFRPPEM